MKWFIPIKPQKEYLSIAILVLYNQFMPILFSFSSCSFFFFNNFIVGYFLLVCAFIPIFFPLKFEFEQFYFSLI